jgi:asparagine synthase (glutamine-hydrolysing)
MCGIIGATGIHRDALEAALGTFSYRGPDAKGFGGNADILLGHARLSIIDLDPRSNQPLSDASGRCTIVFNGEIYNYKEIKDELHRTCGAVFRTESDTEVLLLAYMQWGKELLPRLRGMFAFAIHDTRSGHVFLARDHAGIKPLYYSTEGELTFASELKGVVALKRSRGDAVELDTDSVDLYRAFGYIPTPRTPIVGIQKLDRASWLSYDLHTREVTTGTWAPQTRAATSVEDMEALVRESIIEHTIADVPVGLFFSGGIDSSVLALVLQDAGIRLETFSISLEGRDADEPYFRDIAKRLGVTAHSSPFGMKETAEIYEHVFSKMDDPIADTSILPTAYVSRMARERATVVLSGEGGDELFQGYPRQEAIAAMDGVDHRSHILDTLLTVTPAFPGKRRTLLALAQRMRDPSFFYLLTTSLSQDQLDARTWAAAQQLLSHTDPLWLDRDWYLENMLLRKGDMATMYSSLEGRVPLLGAQVWNAAPGFVRANLAHGTKTVLRDMLKKRLPAELVDRPKAGFGISTTRLFSDFRPARSDLAAALGALQSYGFPAPAAQEMLMERYPAYAFGIVALYRSLRNLEVI